MSPFAPRAACPVCRRVSCSDPEHRERWRRQRVARPYNHQEREQKARVVAEWVERMGYWCPGYEREAHASMDLTADHVNPVGLGGDPLGEMQILCRGCNAKRGNKLRESR